MSVRVAYDIAVLAIQARLSMTGIARVIGELMDALGRRRDADLTLLGYSHDELLPASVSAELYVESRARSGPFPFAFTPAYRSRLGLSGVYREVLEAFWAKGFADVPKLAPRSLAVRGALRAVRRISRLDVRPDFDPGRHDVYHSPCSWLPPRSVTGPVPRVLTVYDLIPLLAPEFVESGAAAPYVHKVLASLDPERDWVVCISEHTRQEFCAFTGMSPDRVAVAPLAAARHFRPVTDPGTIAAAGRRYGLSGRDYLLSIANMEPRKNLAHLVRSFFRLLAEHPALDLDLVLVGSRGFRHDEVLSAARGDPRFAGRVVFTGQVADEDLSAVYSGSRALVYPSLYEGFGLPPLEAMRCGVPVIASNATAIPEVVGDAGLLVDPRDADALCQAMLDVATDDRLAGDLRRRGHERAQRFTWEQCAEDTMALYRRALEGARRA